MNKVWLVAVREYVSTVKRKGFVIATLGMPLFFMLIFGIAALVGLFTVNKTRNQREVVGIVDESGLIDFGLLPSVQKYHDRRTNQVLDDLASALGSQSSNMAAAQVSIPSGRVEFRVYGARDAVHLDPPLRGYYVVPANYLESGEIQLLLKKGSLLSDDRPGWRVLQSLMDASLAKGRVDATIAGRLWMPPKLKAVALNETGQVATRGVIDEVSQFAVPYVFTIFFMLSIMTSAGYLLQSVAEEKENRVMEVLLSSLTPDQLLAGKVIGLGGAGLTQILVWVVVGVFPSLAVAPFLDLHWSQLLVAIVFFVLGFLLFGSLMGGFGSIGSNLKESQQTTMIWTLMAVVPLFFVSILIAEPNGTLARVLSYIPFTAPITMMLRVACGPVPWWDIGLSALILGVSLLIFVRLAAKVFRLGVLMYGKRPTVFEIVRWLRAA